MNKTEILKQYQADNVKIAPEFMSWMRSNHAGETGAVWIYKGASYVFWSKKLDQWQQSMVKQNNII